MKSVLFAILLLVAPVLLSAQNDASAAGEKAGDGKKASASSPDKAPEGKTGKGKGRGEGRGKGKGKGKGAAVRGSGGSESLADLRSRFEANPEDPENWIALARAHEARALKLLEQARERFPDGSATEALAESYLRAGRGQEALDLLEEAMRSSSKDGAYWLRLGRIAARLGGAIDENNRNRLFDRAVEHADGNIEVLTEASDYYLATGQADQARAVCREALDADPKAVAPRLRLSLIHEREGDSREALALLEESLLLDRSNPEVRRALGGFLLRQQRLSEAVPHLRKSLEAEGATERDFSAVARLMVEAEQVEESIELLREAIERFPDQAEFPLILTFALVRLEKWDEAIEQFETTRSMALDQDPDLLDTSFHFRYGAALERAGRIDEAVTALRRAVGDLEEVEVGDDEADFAATVLNYLAYIWIERSENLDEAGPMALRAYALSPENGAIADTVGWLHFQKGDYARALSELKKAERLVEEPDAVIFDHLGQTLAKLGETELAADYFRRASRLEPEKTEYEERLKALEPDAKKDPEKEKDDGKDKSKDEGVE